MRSLSIIAAIVFAAPCAYCQVGAKVDTLTVTTKTGTVEYKNVVVTKVEPDGVRVMHDAGPAKVAYDNLPDAWKSAVPFDPEAAAKFKVDADRVRRQQEHENAILRERLREDEAIRKKAKELELKHKGDGERYIREMELMRYQREMAEQGIARIRGNVIQVAGKGLLVDAHFGTVGMDNYHSPALRPQLIDGLFLLTNHPYQTSKVDKDWFDVDVVEDGVYEYTTVTGVSKRIRVYKTVKAYY